MSFTSEVANKQFKLNLVLSIDGTFYSKFQVDTDTTDIAGTGSKIDADKIGIVDKVSINPFKVDIRDVRTTIQTVSFDLLDLDELISITIGNDATQLLNKEVILRVGFINTDIGGRSDFDLSDYLLISRTRIKNINKKETKYSFNATEVSDLMNKDMLTTSDTLNGSITDVVTTLTLNDASSFPATGRVKIEDEVITYSGKSTNDLTGLTRGVDSSTAAAHDDETQVFLVTKTADTNPIDLMLQLIISPGGGGAFDVLTQGLGISQTLVDTTEFTSIRDSFFATDEFRFDLVDVGNGLTFLEQELCKATNTRFVNKNGKISLAILDQIEVGAVVNQIDEDSIIRNPSYRLNSDRIVNRIEIKHGFSLGANKFSRVTISEDTDSQTDFDKTTTLQLEFKGIQNDLNGVSIAQNRANRLLDRLKTARASISVTVHLSEIENDVGDKVDVIHRYLPQQGGGLGFSEQMEILSKAVDFNTGEVRFDLEFTSFSGLRIGLIAPSPLPTLVTSQTVFTVPDGACYRIGDKLRLWDDVAKDYFVDPVNEILDVTGDVITMVDAWATSLNTTNTRIKIADYDQASDFQHGKYAFICDATGFFNDATKCFQVIF